MRCDISLDWKEDYTALQEVDSGLLDYTVEQGLPYSKEVYLWQDFPEICLDYQQDYHSLREVDQKLVRFT